MKSFQNLLLLQNLYRLKAIGYEYIDSFSMNNNQSSFKPNNLEQLFESIKTCHLCDLSKSRSQSMGGYGNPNAELMIIDFSVSMSEDSSNSYYCGRSGEILKNMIENVLELRIEEVFFTHAVKCKPLNSNHPSASEWESCKNYLFSQLDFIKPKVVVTLGSEAYSSLTNDAEDFETLRGHVIDFKQYKLIPIYHPQYLLRNPEQKRVALNDLKTIKGCL